MDRVLMFVIGLVFLGGGLIFARDSLGAKNLIESALFALMGVAVGLWLCITAVVGPEGG